MKYNLYILSTPSQAFFLSKMPELIRNGVLVLTVTNKDFANRILKYLDNYSWKTIHIIIVPSNDNKNNRSRLIFFRVWLWYFKLKYSGFEAVHFGSYSNLFQLSILSEYENLAESYLLYDGTQILAVAKNRMDLNHKIRRFPKSFIFLNFKQTKIDKLHLVSPFNLKVGKKDKSLKISCSSKYSGLVLDGEKVLFVGQPLIQLKIITETFYYQCLKALIKKFPNQHFSYVPHPKENPIFVSKIKQLMDIQKFDGIFEYELFKSKVFPATVISFFSSVLPNLSFLDKRLKLYALNIPESEFLRKSAYDDVCITYEFMLAIDNPKIEFLFPVAENENSITLKNFEKGVEKI